MKLHRILLLFGASALLLTACGDDGSTIEEADADDLTTEEMLEQATKQATGEDFEQVQKSEEAENEVNELPKFDVGEIMILSEPHGDVLEVVVTRVTDRTDALPDYLQGSDYYNWENLITIDVQYTNIDMPENTSIGLYDFQAYDEDGMIMEFINQEVGGDEVSKGRTGTSTFFAEYNEPQDTIELDFILDGETLGTIIADVEH